MRDSYTPVRGYRRLFAKSLNVVDELNEVAGTIGFHTLRVSNGRRHEVWNATDLESISGLML
jgi:hypothetical protein